MNKYPIISKFVVSGRNQVVAMYLIERFKVNPGYGLAAYLDVPTCNDNYTAIYLWVQYQSLLVPKKYNTLGELALGFIRQFPQEVFK